MVIVTMGSGCEEEHKIPCSRALLISKVHRYSCHTYRKRLCFDPSKIVEVITSIPSQIWK
jgi:hypothetical protein